MLLEERIADLVAPSLVDQGYELVRVLLMGKQHQTLQIMAERVDRGTMTVEDCAAISRAISAILDVADPIGGAYTLEVSSPGIDRPLTKLEHYARFAGFEAKIETREPVDGRRRFRGTLVGADAGEVSIQPDDTDDAIAVPFSAIQKGKLVLTDALIKASQAGAAEAAAASAEVGDERDEITVAAATAANDNRSG